MSKNIDVIIGNLKDQAKQYEAESSLEGCTNLLSEHFDNVIVSQYAAIDLSSKNSSPDIRIKCDDNGLLVLCVGDKPIKGQRDLKINSKVNDVVNLDVNILVTKQMLWGDE